MGVLCLFHVFSVQCFCPISLCKHLDGEESAGCCTSFLIFLVSCDCMINTISENLNSGKVLLFSILALMGG